MRSIIRFSVDGEKNSALRNQLAKILTDAGYVLNPHVTATWEAAAISPEAVARTMEAFWNKASQPPPGVSIDHVWMYADNPPDEIP